MSLPHIISVYDPGFFQIRRKRMKTLRSGLFVLALASLICLFFSNSAFAQLPTDDPCCNHAPGISAGAIQNDIQPLTTSINIVIDTHVNQTETAMLEQPMWATIGKATEMPAAIEQSWTPNYRRQP